MAKVKLVLFRDPDGSVPLLEWLDALQPKARAKCRVWLERLRDHGHELRRPDADYLRDGVYELRVGWRHINYRMMYFFHGREVVVVSHGIVKERLIPAREIDLAVRRMNDYRRDPARHTYEEA
ncbi:MAG TPA: type II toxin-antitoxin system RelE/ParE family toxin [Lacipirellulaceae bacterium]|nr:type II toxin-antitoxin system RelE/ParE family toxin [Lacipirellulaceae bacterium]